MQNKETLLITGAGGFIGGRVTEVAYFSEEFHPRAGIHTWKGVARIARFPLAIVKTDIMDKADLAKAMQGVGAVVHCAFGSPEVTIEGTRNVLEAALEEGVRRFVHLSTVEVYGAVTGEVDETLPFKYTGNSYGDSKIEAEKIVWEFHHKGLPVVVFRPAIVYGPFSKIWTMNFTERFQSGNWHQLSGFGDGLCNLVYIDDVVSLILHGVHDSDAIGQAFNVVGPEVITWNDYFQRFNHALGFDPLKQISQTNIKLSSLFMEPIRVAARYLLKNYNDHIFRIYERYDFAKRIMKKGEHSIRTTPSRAELKLFSRAAIYSARKAQHLIGYRPKYDIDSSLKLTIGWLRHNGFAS